MTPAAVSRQVKLLENYFGVEFFDREPGGVLLTPEAQAYATGLGKAFRQIAAVTDEFRTNHTSSILTVRGYTTFLVKWLVPRLPDFQKLHPQIKVRLASGSAAADPSRAEADVMIRYGRPPWPGYQALPLFRDELVPVCSAGMLPSLRGRTREPWMTVEQIARLPLLSLEARREDWLDWFSQSGIAAPKERLQSFEDLAIVLEFARRGLGVAIAQRRYIEEDLAIGSLVVISREVLQREAGYYALTRVDGAAKTKITAFFTWLAMHQAEEFRN